MLSRLFVTQMSLGVAQTVVAAILALAVMALARQRSIHLERETVVALARGIVQIVAVGSVLVLLLQGPAWRSVFVLAAMMIAAAAISARRADGVAGAFQVSLYGIGFGSGVVIVLMTLAGVIDPAITSPSCCNMPNWSETPHSSTIFPLDQVNERTQRNVAFA
jgi:putative ABC transport system permease protein